MAARRAPAGVAAAAATGDQRATLEAIRDQLAAQLEAAPPAVAAQIAGQLRQTLKDIAALPAERKGSKLVEVKARRQARRRAASTAPAAAGRGGRQRG